MQHIACRVSSSIMNIFINGILTGSQIEDRSVKQTQNQANVYIGNKGGKTNFLTGSLSQINIFNKDLSNIKIKNTIVAVMDLLT